MTPYLSIVIPVYNEKKSISETLRRITAFMSLKARPWEILVSDDGSTDGTQELLKKIAGGNARIFLSTVNQKKGAAVRRAVLEAQGENILVTDVDLSSPIKEVDKLLSALEKGADVAVGSRALREKGADVQQSFNRWLAGRVYNFFVRLIVLDGIYDTQCGFKCFRKEAAHRLFSEQKMNGFSFDVEILYLARKKGLRIAEVPVMWRQGEESRVHVFKDSFKMVQDLFKIRKLHG